MPEEDTKEHNFFIILICLSSIAVIVVSIYFFYFKKSYDFIVETSCDPTAETCRYRDCEIVDECPPNNLSYYNEYTILASDFQACTNEDCTQACKEGTIECTKTECTTEELSIGICVPIEPKEVLDISINTDNLKEPTKK